MVINILDLVVYIIGFALIVKFLPRLYDDEIEGVTDLIIVLLLYTIIYLFVFVIYDVNISDFNFGAEEEGKINVWSYFNW